ncbi:MAG: hypothetical protein ACI808_002164 [Paraglaciecola sp.]|jgi:hypothetical protein
MILKVLPVALMLFLLSGCEILDLLGDAEVEKTEIIIPSSRICVLAPEQVDKLENCNIDYWMGYWAGVDTLTWPERRAEIDNLSGTVPDTLKKVLLSQGKGTPYQNRLRAQTWAISIMPALTDEMRALITVAVFQTSQELLELESALVTLSKINTNQSNRVEEQQLLIEQQKDQIERQKNQIEQLLNIEASIMDNSKGDNQ